MRSQQLARLLARPLPSCGRQTQRCCQSLILGRRSFFSTPSMLRSLHRARPLAIRISHFSSSTRHLRPSGTVDEELIAKLDSEISVETNVPEDETSIPTNVKEYLDESPFELIDKRGQEEVELVRKFGDETIRVLFSIADMNSTDDKLDDSALYDGDEISEISDDPEGSKTKSKNAAQNDDEEQEDEEYDDGSEPPFPVRLNITIEKPNHGALQIETLAQDSVIIIENLHFHKDAKLATTQTAEADYERRGHYVGPPFGNLDDELQVLLERYLDERGINENLAVFVPNYIEYKEQKEYLSWLKNVKTFVES